MLESEFYASKYLTRRPGGAARRVARNRLRRGRVHVKIQIPIHSLSGIREKIILYIYILLFMTSAIKVFYT